MKNEDFLRNLEKIVGKSSLLVGRRATRRYRIGYRYGEGNVLAVAMPRTLVELWRTAELCARERRIIILQAANTGLTGGSTPFGDYDRDVVVISTTKLNRIIPILDGRQVVCFSGARLNVLEKKLEQFNREPHSVIGSSCIGASVVGGVCNNSGGALVTRGPAYTECSLYARVELDGRLALVNNLGFNATGSPEQILAALETDEIDYDRFFEVDSACSARDYVEKVRDTNSATPARYNADPEKLFDASGCAGKVIVFAVRLDTFPKPARTKVFFIGTNSTAALTAMRRKILEDFKRLPDSAEYMHRTAFNIAECYGRDMFAAISLISFDKLPLFFSAKNSIDSFFSEIGMAQFHLTDRILQLIGSILPNQVPQEVGKLRDLYEHYLVMKVSDEAIDECESYLADCATSSELQYLGCSPSQGKKVMLHRFVTAGAAMRYAAVHSDRTNGVTAIDTALPRNAWQWVEELPEALKNQTEKILYYGHFLCHVFHQDYILKKGVDSHAFEQEVLRLLDARGAKYPAEHNVGHLYKAEETLRSFYLSLDPSNTMNPGIGCTPKCFGWNRESGV
ncbi:D-lactate dehydrogenase [Hyphococcus sp.]|uniref:D-lactate dehydrogenase n=1 Tax=Hyphococcus sp. TaxID=2038636 RepID=UPI003CCB9133